MDEHRDLTDEDLALRAVEAPEGDLRAFEQLIRRYQQRIVTNCRCITRSPDDAPDLAQEVFVKAFFGVRRFEGRSKFGTWLNRIKVNHCLNFLRRSQRATHVSTDDPDVDLERELAVEHAAGRTGERLDDRTRIQAALDALPETLRVPLVLRDLDGLSYQEIAEQLELGLSAVKMRIKRAREAFRERFERRGETDD